MKPAFLLALCLVATATICAASKPAADTTGVAPSSLLEGFESRPDLKSWLGFWATKSPGLCLDSFQVAYSGDFYGMPLDYANPTDSTFPSFAQRVSTLVFSPDSTMAIDPFPFDLRVIDDSLILEHDVDSFLYLVDVGTKTGVRVFQCGTPCFSQRISWVDADRVALVGMNATGKRGAELRPAIYLVDLRTRTWTQFHGPQVDGFRKLEYSAAWRAWQDQELGSRD